MMIIKFKMVNDYFIIIIPKLVHNKYLKVFKRNILNI